MFGSSNVWTKHDKNKVVFGNDFGSLTQLKGLCLHNNGETIIAGKLGSLGQMEKWFGRCTDEEFTSWHDEDVKVKKTSINSFSNM